MNIESMFSKSITRPINGVVQVGQDTAGVLKQEVEEYVITREIRKHFITFFSNYGESFHTPTADMGVWISGFFGSGKSHFLKMLSYFLENKSVDGKPVVEYFRDKFEDEATFMPMAAAVRGQTDTILFNIDIEGSINKDKTAVLKVFAKMFYNYLGFYGEDLKTAKLEQFIAKRGKTEEFRRVFEEKNGGSWLDSRDACAFFEDDVVETLMEVLGMSETAARNWFNGTETVETSIAQLVSEIKDYVNTKPANFRLLFMIDEVGQYVGGDTDLLLNLQSLVEKLGSECGGKVWVICTGQEAIDEIIKARENEFSRIQARFKTRLSLSSASADEVIQKRILDKKPEAEAALEAVYDKEAATLRNLFTFTESVLDIKGYSGPSDFTKDFPFVPYQFILMQKVFSEIRKHGNSGKHLSGGERSMLSGFQEAAKVIKTRDEYALAPFYLFYDTVHTFLESAIRRVIERCQRAADDHNGIEQMDVNVLKLLYLIRYIEDVKANLDNIVILMADSINMDKITMREQVRASLNRLLSQNYIGRTGNTYHFLTDEEQDIQREIKNAVVDTSAIVEKISHIVYGDIFTTKKFRHLDKYDFSFNQYVDNAAVGAVSGGMTLRILTAGYTESKAELHLRTESAGQAIVVLPEGSTYYESLENALKIRKYIKQRNVSQLSRSMQTIIQNHQAEAGKLESAASAELRNAIVAAEFYVDGEHIEIKSGDAKSKLEQALSYLVTHVYRDLDLIRRNADSDADVSAILTGYDHIMPGMDPNRDAAVKVEEYLELQHRKNLPTSMADVQTRYQQPPYGWREVDIAAVMARLIVDQKVTIRYAGATVQPTDPKLPDMLRKKSEIGKTSVSKRISLDAVKMRKARALLREYFDVMDVPEDEDGLIAFVITSFTHQKAHFEQLLDRYEGHKYPDKDRVKAALQLVGDILSQQKDNITLIRRLTDREDDLLDSKEDLQNVESFFKTQVQIFEAAVQYERELRVDLDYLNKNETASEALNQIRLIVMVHAGTDYVYRRIPELNGLMASVRSAHEAMLAEKREELKDIAGQCMAEVYAAAKGNVTVRPQVEKAVQYYENRKKNIDNLNGLILLDGQIPTMWQYKDQMVKVIEDALKPKPLSPDPKPVIKKRNVKSFYRNVVFPTRELTSEQEIDEYVERIRQQLKQLLTGCDEIQIK